MQDWKMRVGSCRTLSLPVFACEVCDRVNESAWSADGCEARSALFEFNEGAVALFILSQLMLGVASSPTSSLTMTYMDDNARDQSPKYFGPFFSDDMFLQIVHFDF